MSVTAGLSRPGHHGLHHIGSLPPAGRSAGVKCACSRLEWPRRLHALAGSLAMAFLVVHLGTCLFGFSPGKYTAAVDRLEAVKNLAPALVFAMIFLPFAYQAGSGLYLLHHHGMKFNVNKCNRGGKTRFFLQRVTGILILLFLLLHVATLHAWGLHAVYRITGSAALGRYAAGGIFAPGETAFRSTVAGISQAWSASASGGGMNLTFSIFSLVGVLAVAFHAGNGIWSGGWVWKLAGTPERRKLLGCAATAVMTIFALAGGMAWYAFTWSNAARNLFAR